MSADDLGKVAAARHAATMIENGMLVGLGTGSTAALFITALGERVRAGLKIVGVPTSEATARQATHEGITLTTLEEQPRLDVDVDGADAADRALNLLKGLGGALLREKIVAAASKRFIVIMTEDKCVEHLASAPLMPVEVVTFGWSRTQDALQKMGATTVRRMKKDAKDQVFVTDGGNYLLDCSFANFGEPEEIAARIKALTGVVDHGLFIGMATEAVIGAKDGSIRVVTAR